MAKLVLGCLVEPAFKGLPGGAGGRRRGGTPSGPSPMPDDAVHAPGEWAYAHRVPTETCFQPSLLGARLGPPTGRQSPHSRQG